MRLNPGDMYSRTSSFTIPASFENDAYNIMVRTDYKENVFEFNAESNNNRSTEVTISQLLPDLVVDTLSVLLNEGTEHVQLFVNWTISNIGAASTLNFQWADRLYLQNVDVSTPFILGERTVHLSLKSTKNYSVVGQSFSLPNHIFGKMNLMLLTDAIGQLDEESDNNNNYSLLIDIPMLVPDLMSSSLTLLNNGEIYPNSLIKLQWKVKNVGRGKVEEKCEDSIYLLSSPIYGSKVWLGKIERFLVLKSNEEYNVSAEVKIPQNAYAGVHYIEVRVNSPVIVYEAGQSNNNAIKINILIRYPPTADLIITSVTYTSHDIGNVDRFLALLWSGKNIGNSMQNKNTWKDQVKIFAKNVDPEISADGYTLGMFTVSASLRTNQQYSVYKIIPIPSFIEGEISVQVVSDYENSVEEIDGEGNNVYQMKKKINVGIPKRGKLIVKVLKDIPKKASYFASLPVFFNVRNVGEYVTSVSSWIDALYLHVYSSDTVDNIVARGIRLSAILHNGELEVGGEYYVNTTTTVPAISPMEYYVHFIVDSNDVLGSSERTSSSNRTLTVSVGPLPDLTVNPIESKETAKQGGSPYEVRFNVTNIGMAHTNVAWYDGIYLSEDATLDPFDWHLGVTERPLDLQSNESYIQITNVFLPFDLPSRDYYLIFKADTTDKVLETNNGNNQAYQLIKILEAPSADIFVRHVQATPVATLNSDMTFRWNLGNNGSLAASGYRCDATYFSRDDEIDFDDYELGEVTCNTFSINPSGNDTSNDITETKRVKVPLVEEGTFKTIVRTRSNVRDINPVNNVGVSINATFVNITKLAVDGASFEITLKSMEKKIFRLPEVFPEETLVVTLKSDTMTDINRLYLRGKRPPSTSEFDAMSAGELSADKIVVIPVTKAQDYYCLVQNVGSLSANVSNPSKVQLIAKYAKFEVTSVFPQRAAPIGKTTLQIIGTLFPEYVNVSLFNKQNSSDVLKPIEVYRFSSTEIYATFELDGLDVGTMFDIRLTDRRSDSNKASYSPSDGALRLFPGIPGKLSFSVKTSEALRPGEKGFVTVHTYNRGDTDAPLKMMLLSIDKVKGRLVSRNLKTEYSSDILFVPVSSYGPGGILPPKGYADITFEVESNQNTRSSGLQISTMGTSEDKEHIFVEAKELLKPIYYTDEQWEPVWKNFISSVGKTEESLVKKLNAVSSYLSSLGRKISSVTGMIKFLIDVADGTFLTGSQPYIVDDVDTNETLAHGYSVLLRRKYSFSLGSRNSFGVLGRGWILPWW